MPISIVIPAVNEAGNIGGVLEEIYAQVPDRLLGEVIVVDDGSDDATGVEVKALLGKLPNLRYIRHCRQAGKSTALRTGTLAAQYPVVMNMDGDGQNDPSDVARLFAKLGQPGNGPALVCGTRANRIAKQSRRLASRSANWLRNKLLKDDCPDTACGLKLYWRDTFLQLPFFTTMHRFLPALFLTYGHKVAYELVNDRPRIAGKSKYTNLERALIGFYDLIGVTWLRKRTVFSPIEEDLQSAGAATELGLGAEHESKSPASRGWVAGGEVPR
ncbi:MAG TPA: glycosyltransferase family 2 protein [Methyloceanibacter sp.]|jgi:glycosyltransferase involved in cell wall biosynthesis